MIRYGYARTTRLFVPIISINKIQENASHCLFFFFIVMPPVPSCLVIISHDMPVSAGNNVSPQPSVFSILGILMLSQIVLGKVLLQVFTYFLTHIQLPRPLHFFIILCHILSYNHYQRDQEQFNAKNFVQTTS